MTSWFYLTNSHPQNKPKTIITARDVYFCISALSHLGVSYHGAGDLLGPSHLPRAQGAFSREVKAQAVGGDQGAPLIGLAQDATQGEVQDVRCRVVAHDRPATSLRRNKRNEQINQKRNLDGGKFLPFLCDLSSCRRAVTSSTSRDTWSPTRSVP